MFLRTWHILFLKVLEYEMPGPKLKIANQKHIKIIIIIFSLKKTKQTYVYKEKVILCIIVIVIFMWAIPVLHGNANKDCCCC